MAINLDRINGYYLFTSRESFRKKIIDRIQEYENLTGVDLSKTQFFSYLIDIISIIGADNANSLTITKKENYLVTAVMPSSVYNWARYLGYTKKLAQPSSTNLVISIPLSEFSSSIGFTFKKHHRFMADDIVFSLPYEVNCYYNISTNTLEASLKTDTNIITLLVYKDNNNIAHFTIPVKQYEIIDFDYNVDPILNLYQPFSFEIEYHNYYYSIDLYTKDTVDSIPEQWQWVDSYFDMSINENQFTTIFSDEGKITVLFGNGVYGKQPNPSSIVFGTIWVTKGEEGNVIAGAIRNGEPVFVTENGLTKQVTYSCTNPEPATNGINEESLDEIKKNAIERFKARHRLVSEDDYQNLTSIVDEPLPFVDINSVLKRSDLKTNEIVSFIVLGRELKEYSSNNLIIDSENEGSDKYLSKQKVYLPIPTNSIKHSTTWNPTGIDIKPFFGFATTESIGVVNWYCPFGIRIVSPSSTEFYYMTNITDIEPLSITYYDRNNYSQFYPKSLRIQQTAGFTNYMFTLQYDDFYTFTNNFQYIVTLKKDKRIINSWSKNFTTNSGFNNITINVPATIIPLGEIEIQLQVLDITVPGSIRTVFESVEYYTIKKDLSRYIFSNNKYDPITNTVTVYDIPVIESNYWNSLSVKEQIDFERNVLQKMVSDIYFGKYRMITNSINIKFAKTFGDISSWFFNRQTVSPVIDIVDNPPPAPAVNDRYIVGQNPTGSFTGHTNQVAIWRGASWQFLDCNPGDIVLLTLPNQIRVFSGNANRWIEPKFKLPLDVKVHVRLSKTAPFDNVSIIKVIKNTVMYTLAPSFKINGEIDRSLLYEAIQNLQLIGVQYCEIKLPEVNLTFNYDIEDLTKAELIEYVPCYLWTDEDHIEVHIDR